MPYGRHGSFQEDELLQVETHASCINPTGDDNEGGLRDLLAGPETMED